MGLVQQLNMSLLAVKKNIRALLLPLVLAPELYRALDIAAALAFASTYRGEPSSRFCCWASHRISHLRRLPSHRITSYPVEAWHKHAHTRGGCSPGGVGSLLLRLPFL